jgi:flagellar hook protein FlgE
MPSFPRDSELGLVPIRIDTNQRVGDPTTAIRLGVNLPSRATTVGANGDSLPLSVEYFGNLGTSETLQISFTPTVPTAGIASNSWTMQIRDSALGGTVVGEYAVTFDASRGSGGAIETVTAVSGGSYDPAQGTISITVAGGPITLAIGTPGASDGLTQLDSSFAPVCAFRGIWAVISRDRGHAFHAIVGSCFANAGSLTDGIMESGLTVLVKRFLGDASTSQAFPR